MGSRGVREEAKKAEEVVGGMKRSRLRSEKGETRLQLEFVRYQHAPW